jgi:hypothetical protein
LEEDYKKLLMELAKKKEQQLKELASKQGRASIEGVLTPIGPDRKIRKRTNIIVAFHPEYSKYRIHRKTCEFNYSPT